MVLGLSPVAVTWTSYCAAISSKEFLDIQATIECGFSLKCVGDMTRTYGQMDRADKYSEHSSIIWSVWPNVWVFVYKLSGSRFVFSCSHLNLRFFDCAEQGLPWLQATVNNGFTLKCAHDMTRTYGQMHRTDKYSEHSSIVWSVGPNGWVFIYELTGSVFESSCSHFNFRFRVFFKQGVPWNSHNYRLWIHFEMRTWHDKNI